MAKKTPIHALHVVNLDSHSLREALEERLQGANDPDLQQEAQRYGKPSTYSMHGTEQANDPPDICYDTAFNAELPIADRAFDPRITKRECM